MTPAKFVALFVIVWFIVVLSLIGVGVYQTRQRTYATLYEDPGQFCVRIAIGYDLIRCYDVDTGNFCYLRGKESVSCVAGPFVERVPMLR